MRNFTIYLCLFLASIPIQPLQAQEKTIFEKMAVLEKQKEDIIEQEKEALKKEVENINQRREAKEISKEEAERLKEEAAKKHALNIENRVAIIDNKIALLSRGQGDGSSKKDSSTVVSEKHRKLDFDLFNGDKKEVGNKRTYLSLVVAAGFNNALSEGQGMNDSDFKVGESRFLELGLAWTYRVFDRSNWLRFRYGFSFQLNGLMPTENRYFVQEEEKTLLVEHEYHLNKSKFRMDNLVVPLHFEFGPSKKVEDDRYIRYYTKRRLQIGLGGYAGISLGERQKLKFERDGEDIKSKLKGNYNINEFIYGLSGYLAWGDTSIYVKYDLNPIFKEPNMELHNFSVGLRFDID